MADSGITKRALAEALKALMEEMPFAKISVADICERCDMNRKSFYYHFKDKYDLLNWIVDTEFLSTTLRDASRQDSWGKIYDLFVYLYENQSFVRKALAVEGQNSPAEHFRVLMEPMIAARMKEILGSDANQEFRVNFFCDAFRCTIERWIVSPDCVPPDVFLSQIKDTVRIGAEVVYRSFEESSKA
ncbi:MAG: TetR/AcrR family transcriptional regulator C-terminal domain-containing protein [Clostridia bacterium]|nr:TetR/AcrR family transcriptional regulator C-terminal domain-containing protein [Clostridia bacterium]